MQSTLTIVHIISSFVGGGLENFVIRLAKDQMDRGHHVCIISLHDGPLFQQAQKLGLDAHVLQARSRVARLIRCRQFFRNRSADIIHAHNPTVLHYAAIGKIFSSAKIVMTDHAQTRGIARYPSMVERKLTSRVVAVSEHTAKQTHRIGFSGKIKVIHNGVDFTPPATPRETVRQNLGLGDRPAIINVAGLLPVKAQDILIRAIALLRDQDVGVVLLIAGEGTERYKLENLCQELDLNEDWVRLLGFRADIPDLLNASDIFALVSRNEGLPMSVLEAMSHGLPIIATPAGGVGELVRHGRHGLIVPFDDPSEVADAVKKMVTNRSLCRSYGESAKQYALDQFSFRIMSEKYLEVYHNLMDN